MQKDVLEPSEASQKQADDYHIPFTLAKGTDIFDTTKYKMMTVSKISPKKVTLLTADDVVSVDIAEFVENLEEGKWSINKLVR